MCGGQWNNTGDPEHLKDGGLGDRQILHIFDSGHPMATHHLVQFGLDAFHVRGMTQHEHLQPQKGGFDGFHAGRKQIRNHLHDLFICKRKPSGYWRF